MKVLTSFSGASCKIPIKIWTDEEIGYRDIGAIDQAVNLANHPLAWKYVCLMPDFHLGYGMPIGGVLATRGGVIPNAVGVDIGCGMIAVQTQLPASELSRDMLQKLRVAIHARVPVGTAHHERAQIIPDSISDETGDDSALVCIRERERASYQVGTLGGGNHFIEIQKEDTEEGQVWIMLHSGSRNVGLRVCNHYHAVALDAMEKYHSAVPDKDLAFLPEGAEAYRKYLVEMRWCMAFAELNRKLMLEAVFDAFSKELGLVIEEQQRVDTHHNFAAMENHFGHNVLVHRKGAVKASGLVTIPGSMGTASYICEGLNPKESFNSCSHGAGRVMSRKEAKGAINHEQAVEMMAHVVYGVREGGYDEHPHSYKDIEAVIRAQADLVKPLYRLLPLAVVKG